MTDELHTGPAPPHLRGVWRRLSIEWADGRGDIATTVLWGQSDRLFCDLRIPAARPAAGVSGFEGLSVDDAVALASQEGFAGELITAGDRCDWLRRIDFRPLCVADAGLVSLSGRMLVETGLDGAYVEHWWRDLDDAAPEVAGRRDPASGRISVTLGDVAMTAIDRRPAPPPPGALVDLAADAARTGDASALSALLDCEISYGRLTAPVAWTVELSTLPWAVGTVRAWPAT